MVNAALARPETDAITWRTSRELVPYSDAVAFMEQRVDAIVRGDSGECVWLLQHPPLYTAGSSADPAELVDPGRLPVFPSGRGGRYTWHGPGQRIAYVMLDLSRRRKDLRAFVNALEIWMIDSLAEFGVRPGVRAGRTGVWVQSAGQDAKIAAIGVRIRRWVTFHGVALNVAPDLSHYAGIVPCGIADAGVTSLAALGVDVTMDEVDEVLRATFAGSLEKAELG